jgi:hypothetical protein
LNLAAVSHLLVLNLIQLERVERTNNLANNVIARVPIEAEHDKVQRHALELLDVEPVERKVLVIARVRAVPYDSAEIIESFSYT